MRALRHGSRAATRNNGSADAGQGLVEFALVIPIFMTLLMGVIEFGFLYNSLLTVQYAARQGVSAAAQAGGVDGADCSILNAVEHALAPPVDRDRVEFVDIFQSDSRGDLVPGILNHYVRSGNARLPRHRHPALHARWQ